MAFMQGGGQILGKLTGDKSGKGGGPLSSQVGGPVNYLFFSFWLFIAFAGWAITLGSLSALQHYENKSGLSDGGNGALLTFQKFLKGAQEGVGLFNGPGGWAIKANFPNLNSGRVFRFDWFTCFLQFLTAMFVTTALLSKLIPQVRIALVGYLAATVVLQVLSTDRFYNLSHWHISRGYWSSSRGTMAGYLIAATADFSLMYLLGIQPPTTHQ